MRYKMIACEVFIREISLMIATSPHVIDCVYTKKESHNIPGKLRKEIQNYIDQTEEENKNLTQKYSAILLGFGLCGNATADLVARNIPLILPRSHDCCGIFLGSSARYFDIFKEDLSSEWTTAGYMERGDKMGRESAYEEIGLNDDYNVMVEKYGEDNAKYLWNTLHPEHLNSNELIYIEIPETCTQAHYEAAEKLAAEENKTIKKIEGNISMLKSLVYGNWDKTLFLTVMPNHTIKPRYDKYMVCTSEKYE